jgi:hypothetical protein
VLLVVLIVAASSVAVRAGEPQTCGSLESAFQAKPCHVQTQTHTHWQVDFGVVKLPPLPPEQRMTHSGLRPVASAASVQRRHGIVYDPARSGFENAFVHGLNVIRPPVAKQPIDCSVAKPGDPALDRSMVRQAHGRVVHSAVIVPVAPCRVERREARTRSSGDVREDSFTHRGACSCS